MNIEKNVLYLRVPQSKENPFGLKAITSLNPDAPIMFTLVAIAHYAGVNGAAKVGGVAAGFNNTSANQQIFPNIAQYSWSDVGDSNVQFISCDSNSDTQIIFDKYFKPLLYTNGKIKPYDKLLKTLRNINIFAYCAATMEIKKLAQYFSEELSKHFSTEEVVALVQQVVSVDVTTRIAVDTSGQDKQTPKFTSIHLFSKADDDIVSKNEQFLFSGDGVASGIHVFSDKEVAIVIDRLKIEDGADHNFNGFFTINDSGNSVQGQAVSLLVNILTADMLNSSLQGRTLSQYPLQTLSGVFIPENIALFSQIIAHTDLTTEDLQSSQLVEALAQARLRNKKIMKIKALETVEDLAQDKMRNSFFKKYQAMKDTCASLTHAYSSFAKMYKKFKNSAEFKNLTLTQVLIFNNIFNNVLDNLKVIELVEKSLDEHASTLEDLEKLSAKLQSAKETDAFVKARQVVTYHMEYTTAPVSSNFSTLEEHIKYFEAQYQQSLDILTSTYEP